MPLVEPSAVLLETGEEATFSKADGSGSPVPTTGILEDAISERPTGHTTRETHEWELTCETSAVSGFRQGDTVAIDTRTFEILDIAAKDASFTIFLLSQIS
jgi:hypothetical protein